MDFINQQKIKLAKFEVLEHGPDKREINGVSWSFSQTEKTITYTFSLVQRLWAIDIMMCTLSDPVFD